MNRPCREYKRQARELLNGNYTVTMLVFLTAVLLPFAVELPFTLLQQDEQPLYRTVIFYAAEFLIYLLNTVLSAGVLWVHLALARKKELSVPMVFYGFRNRPDRYIAEGLLYTLVQAVCFVPFGIGAAVYLFYERALWALGVFVLLGVGTVVLLVFAALALSQTLYLMLDHEELSAWRAMKTSCAEMKKHKRRLFYMELSFLGMQALCLLTLGIGCLWVMPYQSQTLALFYLDVTGELPRFSVGHCQTGERQQEVFDEAVS